MCANRTRIIVSVLLSSLLAACGDSDPEPPPAPTRPVKTFVVAGGSGDALRTFPGRIDATQRAELAFRVAGQLQDILVKEGDLVQEGEVIARLDPTDYQLVYDDRKATFDNARANFERGKGLIADGNISRMDFDRMEAEFRTASANLSQAEKNLEYTVLTSPFAGRIARRWVENFEDVQAKQTVFTLQNINELDVIIDLPESVVRMVRRGASDSVQDGGSVESQAKAYARFEGRPDARFRLKAKEIATKADPQTQTFRATWTMDAPTEFTVLPGMTTSVEIDMSALVDKDSVRRVPVRAVQADSKLDARVWVLDPDTMTVSSQDVTIGRMVGRSIEVTDGLDGGEEIVAVGAPYLAEGMKVTRMAQSEQAVPREDDPL
jgi:RND family efflux transporter MFP subunit